MKDNMPFIAGLICIIIASILMWGFVICIGLAINYFKG